MFFHCDQPTVGIHEQLLDVGEVGYVVAVQHAIAGVIDRLVERMRADPDRGRALRPLSWPSDIPTAIAMTFLSAPAVSTPTISSCV